MTTAAIYIRVSSAQQETDGTSLDTQLERCRAYAAEQGLSVSDEHVYRKVHTGTELWQRPKLTALREAVRRRDVAGTSGLLGSREGGRALILCQR